MWVVRRVFPISFVFLFWSFIVIDSTVSKPTKNTPTQQRTSRENIPVVSKDTLPFHAISLTSKNFGTNINDGNVWLIEFYTPWCRHCQTFANSYNNVAAAFHSSPQEGIRIAKVDCDTEKALKTRFGVKSFPTFFVVDGWSVYEFESTRSEAALMDFVRGGYKKQQAIPYYSSPMGPMGLVQGMLLYLGSKAMDIFHLVQESYGLSPILVGMVLSFFVVIGGMISVVILAILTTPKSKND